MKLAASNIAWEAAEDDEVASALRANGFTGVELAPAKAFDRPAEATDAEVAACRGAWERRGLKVVALQALLFGRPDLTIFQHEETRRRTRDHLAAIVRLGGRLGARALVFGSPRNRARGPMPAEEAWPIAVSFFRDLGEVAAAAGTCLCLEPNPPRYGADFAVDSREALRLVEAVGSPGFGLHLDAACALLAGEDLPARIRACRHVLRHLHLSEPDLAPVRPGGTIDLARIGEALGDIGYQGFVSIEMKATGSNVEDIAAAARLVAGGLP